MNVTVLINNYNYSTYLRQCINSVLNQTYSPIEVVVFDDNSQDNSVEILSEYEAKIKLIVNTDVKSRYNSLNQLNSIVQSLKDISGDIIFLLDSDDYFESTKIERVLQYYRKNKHIDSVQDSIVNVDKNASLIGREYYFSSISEFDAINYISSTRSIFGLGPQTSGLSFRRNYLIELISEYNKDLYLLWPDIQLGRRALIEGKAIVISDFLSFRRIHDRNDSHILKNAEHKEMFYRQYSEFCRVNLVITSQKLDSIKLGLSIFCYIFFKHGFRGLRVFYYRFLKRSGNG